MAEAFATAPHILDREALDLLLRSTGACRTDNSLDVACGAGIVACHFAGTVKHATGIDITPAMLDKAKSRQACLAISNVAWDLGSAESLPYEDSRFSIVTSRYALHHLERPRRAVVEMRRVCRPGGVVAIADICVPEDRTKASRFNELERLHDFSHVRAAPLSEHVANFLACGLSQPTVTHYKLDFQLSRLLGALGHRPAEAAQAEEMLRESIATDSLGTDSRIEGGELIFSYPIAVLASRRPHERSAI
jgi:ubiquinone/menaquinone biosynthesis C-methylase UbiE